MEKNRLVNFKNERQHLRDNLRRFAKYDMVKYDRTLKRIMELTKLIEEEEKLYGKDTSV